MASDMFTTDDLRHLEAVGISPHDVLNQLAIFTRGVSPVILKRPCTVGDGIVKIPDDDTDTLTKAHDSAAQEGRMIKFVPASGAASRMFKDWFAYLEDDDFNTSREASDFIRHLHQYAFYDDLADTIAQNNLDIHDLSARAQYRDILEYILTPRGLNYASLPKALLKFHAYQDRTRTSLEEHLVEAARYVKDADNICRMHLTVSDEHISDVDTHISTIRKYYEKKLGVSYDISLSIQSPATDTIATDMDNMPFRDRTGTLVFRPGGHGALLRNLSAIDNDIIFLKNIDNVTPDRLKPDTVLYKKILGGYLVTLQNQVFRYLEALTESHAANVKVSDIIEFLKTNLCISPPAGFETLPPDRQKDVLIEKLDRPIRVCGMVKNEGEPGGGPFWVEKDGVLTLQIIEQAQVDLNVEEQHRIWNGSTHFNPVDLVCGIRNLKGRKYDLDRFVDYDTYFISRKSLEGRDLKALELPGLWNGAMAHWNTVFVEVPISTFNPVKTVSDLLRPEHLSVQKM